MGNKFRNFEKSIQRTFYAGLLLTQKARDQKRPCALRPRLCWKQHTGVGTARVGNDELVQLLLRLGVELGSNKPFEEAQNAGHLLTAMYLEELRYGFH